MKRINAVVEPMVLIGVNCEFERIMSFVCCRSEQDIETTPEYETVKEFISKEGHCKFCILLAAASEGFDEFMQSLYEVLAERKRTPPDFGKHLHEIDRHYRCNV